MKSTIKTEDGFIRGATLDCDFAEILVINKALKDLMDDEDCPKEDVAKIEKMLDEIQESMRKSE